jgi:hypothetical protein
MQDQSGYRRQHRRRLNAMMDGKLEQVLQTFGEVLLPKTA